MFLEDPMMDAPSICMVCTKHENVCDCPECPKCGEVGNGHCYDLKHMEPMHDSIKSLCDHLGIYPIRSALRAFDKHGTCSIHLVFDGGHPRSGEERVYAGSNTLDFCPDWLRISKVGVSGIAWDGSDWEWGKEVIAGNTWIGLDDALQEFDEALGDYRDQCMEEDEGEVAL
mgnify:CR=1 FL=1|tara:strand:+ start:207 stop:719 length:513 start_codon:yes stop_codon:yes gene_type:complete